MDINIATNRMPRRSPMLQILSERPVDQLRWHDMDASCVLPVAKTQGGLGADFGAYVVTTTKFSTRVGPSFCSPPA